LDVRGDNERAVRLYESLGFSRYGLLERFVAVRDARYDKVLMALDLTDRASR
jgi:ribosomal protein S18 acetylase RimI-like enzyme